MSPHPVTLGSAALAIAVPALIDPEWEAAEQTAIQQFVTVSHFDLEAVRNSLRAEPRLVNARFFGWDEAPIEAASHMGNREIAQWLLGSGAPLTPHAAVMLGLRDVAAAYFAREPELSRRPGAHGIAMMFHAALSGDCELCELLTAHGGGQDHSESLHAAVAKRDVRMAQWLLANGAGLDAVNFQGKTPLEAAEANADSELLGVLRKYQK